jgi:hypothetical protein
LGWRKNTKGQRSKDQRWLLPKGTISVSIIYGMSQNSSPVHKCKWFLENPEEETTSLPLSKQPSERSQSTDGPVSWFLVALFYQQIVLSLWQGCQIRLTSSPHILWCIDRKMPYFFF